MGETVWLMLYICMNAHWVSWTTIMTLWGLNLNFWGPNGLSITKKHAAAAFSSFLFQISVGSSGLSAVGGRDRHSGETEGGRNENLCMKAELSEQTPMEHTMLVYMRAWVFVEHVLIRDRCWTGAGKWVVGKRAGSGDEWVCGPKVIGQSGCSCIGPDYWQWWKWGQRWQGGLEWVGGWLVWI